MMNPFASAAIALFIYMTLIFLIALRKKDNSIVDIAWGIGFILVALVTLIQQHTVYARQWFITTLIICWGIRLSIHILVRKIGKPEDPRYAAWRMAWKNHFYLRSFFQIFMLQGLLLLIIASPAIITNSNPQSSLNLLDILGLLMWVLGFSFEIIGDYQLEEFIKKPDNKGRVMKYGLWRYTRHPNYFGESTMWWGIWIIALSSPFGWMTIISPLTITFLLLFVSGVPMTEKMFEGNPEFQEYKKRTSAFIPWFVKK